MHDTPASDPAVVQDQSLLTRLKGIAGAAEQRQAAERVSSEARDDDGPGMLPEASMFVPLPEAWTASGINSGG